MNPWAFRGFALAKSGQTTHVVIVPRQGSAEHRDRPAHRPACGRALSTLQKLQSWNPNGRPGICKRCSNWCLQHGVEVPDTQ